MLKRIFYLCPLCGVQSTFLMIYTFTKVIHTGLYMSVRVKLFKIMVPCFTTIVTNLCDIHTYIMRVRYKNVRFQTYYLLFQP